MNKLLIGFNQEAFLEILRKRSEEVLISSLKIIEQECKYLVPYDTGELLGSIRIEESTWATPFLIIGRVVAGGKNIPQARFTEYGTIAHGPVFARAMRFVWKGTEIYTKWVKGVTPLRWMAAAMHFSLPLIEQEFNILAQEFRGRVTITKTIERY